LNTNAFVALTNYYNALLYLKAVGGQKLKDYYKVSGDEQLVMIYNNMSAVFAKQERWDRVLLYAKKANELDAQNTKSKFRMGQAYLQLEDIEKAKELLEEVLALNPEGKARMYHFGRGFTKYLN
jgi:tetratricopeptide (TPR) repeat protein